MSDRKAVILDCELYNDYFLVMIKAVGEQKYAFVEMFDGNELQVLRLKNTLHNYKIVTFNGNNYDLPVIGYALSGATNAQLKELSDAIITRGLRSWEVETTFGFQIPPVESIDLIEVAPGIASLKIYGGRLHCKKMQDLPIEPDASISPTDRETLRTYCQNDLQTTEDLYNKLKPQLDLREKMSEQYGIDLMSKSDAQIAETVIVKGVQAVTGVRPERANVRPNTKFNYYSPGYIQFKTEQMRDVYNMVLKSDFVVSAKDGKVEMPEALAKAKIKIGSSVYRMGIGGLHSSEKIVNHVVDGSFTLVDRDVTSYYPSIILGMQLAPENMGKDFLTVYEAIVDTRLKAKREGDKVVSDSLKITINGSFGKFGSKYSRLYSPKLLIEVTVTGQLALLMLIESLELVGIPVVSANTDGVVIKCPTGREGDMDRIVKEWEFVTGFETEDTHYSAVYSRDVNNYIAVKTDGKYKTKGVFATEGLQKSPVSTICVDAVINYILKGIPIIDTLLGSTDIRQFVTIRQVKGGGIKDDVYLGKAVRWYYAHGETGCISYKSNGNKVATSDGAKPLMELPDQFPTDIEYTKYHDNAVELLNLIGVRH